MATSAPPTELVLKFSCPSCGHRLTMPIRKAGLRAPCPKCSHQVVAPPIDSSVDGYDQLVAPFRAATVAPPPSAPASVSASHITLEEVSFDDPPVPPPPKAKSYAPPRPAPPPPPPVPPSVVQIAAQPAPPPPPVKATFEELPSAPYAAPVADPAVGRTYRGGGFDFPWRARWTWRLLFWGILVLLGGVGKETGIGFFAFLGLCWFFVGPYVTTQVLMPLCYPSFTCPGCHEVHDAVGLWNCSCGYVPHRVKHLFHKCPECGERGGKTKCPRCGVSMLIW